MQMMSKGTSKYNLSSSCQARWSVSTVVAQVNYICVLQYNMTAIVLVTLHHEITIISNKIPAGMPYLTSIRICISTFLDFFQKWTWTPFHAKPRTV